MPRSLSPPSEADPTESKGRAHDIAVALYRSLEHALTREYARRYDAGVVLRYSEESEKEEATLRIEIDYQDQPELTTTLTIAKHDDRAFHVRCVVQNGTDRAFSYLVPVSPESTPDRLPRLGRALASFLLDELEERLTRLMLDDSIEPLPLEI